MREYINMGIMCREERPFGYIRSGLKRLQIHEKIQEVILDKTNRFVTCELMNKIV
jgi:hypothetical protein